MKKRILSILIALAMVLTLMPGVALATPATDDFSNYCLCGYINNADYGMSETTTPKWNEPGDYVFDSSGKLTATFTEDSYVEVRTKDGSSWYAFQSFVNDGTTTRLYAANDSYKEKMYVPNGTSYTFTLSKDGDGYFRLGYEEAAAFATYHDVGKGTADEPWEISTLEQLEDLAAAVNGTAPYEYETSMKNVFFKLTEDIGSEDEPFTTPIGGVNSFKGNFDGNGHGVMVNINMPSSGYVGLFGQIDGAVIDNIAVGGAVVGMKNVGAICGYNNGGTIRNCANYATVTGSAEAIENCPVGGVCGYNSGTILNCTNQEKVTGGAEHYVGGIAGYNGGTIANCYNNEWVYGDCYIKGGISGNGVGNGIINCYWSGNFSGNSSYKGAIVGYVQGSGAISNCYYDKSVYTLADSTTGVTGLVIEQMKAKAGTTYTKDDKLLEGKPLIDILNGYTDPNSGKYPDNWGMWKIAYDDEYPLVDTSVAHFHDGIEFETAIASLTDLENLFENGGSGYLVVDITATKALSIEKDVKLCLNGKVIDLDGKYNIAINAGFDLYDCDTTTVHNFGDNEGLWTWNDALSGGDIKHTVTGGLITGGKGLSSSGGCVYMMLDSIFNMYGGNICGGTTDCAGGVGAVGTFNMYGGRICGNVATGDGGGVCITGSFSMFGGEITENTAGGIGGGVDVYGPFTVGGTAVIKNNIGHTRDTAIASDAEFDGSTITISSDVAPAEGMEVGVLGNNGDKILGATSGDEEYFFSDDEGLEFVFVDASDDYLVLSTATPVHKHMVDGEETEFTKWTDASSLPSTAGSYYLATDVTLTSEWAPPAGTVNLCLNGHAITLADNWAGINIKNGGKLNLYDCGNILHYYTVEDNGKWKPSATETDNYVTGGVITSTLELDEAGPAVNIENGSFTMNGGTIFGIESQYGWAAVAVKNSSGNTATFTMNGGAICGNVATKLNGYGGGVLVDSAYNQKANSIFVMNGGTISNNVANIGGGIYVNHGTFTMTGGIVTENCAKQKSTGDFSTGYGGGVCLYVGTEGSCYLGGSAKITGNTDKTFEGNVTADNLYVSFYPITLGTGTGEGGNGVAVPDTTSGTGMNVGVTADGKFANCTADYSALFTSDNEDYVVGYNNNNTPANTSDDYLEIKEPPHVHSFTYAVNSSNAAQITATCSGDNCEYNDTPLTLTLTTPAADDLVYSATAKEVSFADGEADAWKGATGNDAPIIEYYLEDGTTKTFASTDEEGKAPVNAGKYVAKATVDTNKTAILGFTVVEKPVTISGITVQDKIYNGKTDDATIVTTGVSFEGIVSGDKLTISGISGTYASANASDTQTVILNAYTEWTLGGTSIDNYKLATEGQPTSATGIISKVDLTVTAKAKSIKYGEAGANNGVEYSGFVNSETEFALSGTLAYAYKVQGQDTDYTTSSPVGTYDIIPSGLTSDNYNIKFVKGTLTVNKGTYGGTKTASGNLKANNGSTVEITLPDLPEDANYGTVTNSNSTLYSVGTVNNKKVTVTAAKDFDKSTESNATSFTVAVTGAKNYEDYDVTVTVTPVFKTVVTINAEADDFIYGDSDKTGYKNVRVNDHSELDSSLVATYHKETETSGQYEATGSTMVPTDAGNYKVVLSVPEINEDYEGSKELSFTISKKAVSITANDKSAYIGETAPELGANDYTVNGLVGSDTLITPPTLSYATTPDMTKAGTVAIKASNAVAGNNYAITYVDGTLTISNRPSSGGSVTSYKVTTEKTKNGTFSVDKKNASSGSTVTITVTPDKGFTLETLTVLDKNGKELEVKDLGNNKYSFKMPKGNVTISVTFMEDNSMLNFFVDVKANDYFYDAVLWAAENKITAGTDAVHFSPNGTTTRGQMVTFLWRMAGSPVFEDDDNKFVDIKKNDYFYDAVVWGWNMGIVSGKSATAFAPDDKVTRAEAVTFIYRYAKVAGGDLPNPFNDLKQGEFYYYPVLWAANNGITSGVNATTFNPSGDCTRGQIACFLYRYNNQFGVKQ